jgi:hypothetical protein
MKKFALILICLFFMTAVLAVDLGNGVEYIPPSRKLGVGTKSPSEQLTVNGNFALKENSEPSPTSGYGKIFIDSTNKELYYRASDFSSVKITNNGALAVSSITPGGSNKQLQYNNSGSFGGAGELYYNGQSLGINIAAPQDQLHVASSTGGASFTHFSNSDTGSNSSDGAQIGINASENLELKNLENKDIIFSTNNTEQMRLNNSGNLGIGISNPSSFKLELNGGHLGPSKTNSVNLGSVAKRFNSVYAKENIYDLNGGIQWGTNKSKSFKTYYSSALVNATTAKTLTDMNGDNFSVTKTYKVTAHNPDVSSTTGAISYFIGNGNSGFTLIDAREEGTGSDHINLYLDSNTPKVKLHSGSTLRNIQLLIEESPTYGSDSNAFGSLQDLISTKAGVVTIAGRGTNPFAQLRLITTDDTSYSETVYGNKSPSGSAIEKWSVGSTGDNHINGSNRFYIFQQSNKNDSTVSRFRMQITDNGNFHFNLMSSGVNDNNGKYVFNGVTAFKEEASIPSSSSGYGKIFVSSVDSELYFRADDQNAVRLTNNGSLASTGATNIDGLSDGKASGQSVFLGELSGNKNTSGEENTALGYLSLSENTTSSYNTAVGKAAMYNFISGNNNTAVGHQAMWMSSSGTWNTAIGSNSLGFNSGSYNTAIGIGSIGGSNQSGNNNTAVGIHTLLGNETGYENSALGESALSSNTTGFRNSAMGYSSMSRNSSGFFNTASGYESLRGPMAGYSTGWYNTATGAQTLLSNTSGNGNTATGVSSLYFNTTGNKNTASGLGSLNFNTTGSNNTASGNRSLYSNTTGSNNTASGNNSLYSNTTGVLNSAFGTSALYFADNGSSNNTAVGYKAGEGTASNEFSNGTFLGYQTGLSLTTGDNNILIGYQAGDNITSGATNLIIGYDNDAPSATASNQLDIGDLIYGDLSDKRMGVGISSIKTGIELDVNGDLMVRKVFGFNGEVANTSSGSITVDWTKGNRQKLTLANSGVTINFTDPPLDSSLSLVITQDASGSKTVSTWDSDVKWPNGTAPTLTTTANAIDMISCLYRSSPKMYLCTASLKFQ